MSTDICDVGFELAGIRRVHSRSIVDDSLAVKNQRPAVIATTAAVIAEAREYARRRRRKATKRAAHSRTESSPGA